MPLNPSRGWVSFHPQANPGKDYLFSDNCFLDSTIDSTILDTAEGFRDNPFFVDYIYNKDTLKAVLALCEKYGKEVEVKEYRVNGEFFCWILTSAHISKAQPA